MKGLYTHLFEPIKIGKVEVKNRIVMAPMGTGLNTLEGGFSNRLVDYYVERARGGVGLLVTNNFQVENDIEENPQMPGPPCMTLNPTCFISEAGEMIERVHAYGTKFFLQASPGMGRNYRICW